LPVGVCAAKSATSNISVRKRARGLDEAWRMGGGVEIGPPCGSAPSRQITVARIATACRVLAIEDEFDGKSIRLSAAGRTHPFAADGRPVLFPRQRDGGWLFSSV
jgi:hypothetical protein